MKLDMSARLRSKPFLVALASLLGMIAVDVFQIDLADWERYVDAVLYALILGGVVIDPSTPGASDKPADK
ncbi:phage holin [Exiguobacterium sp. s22]|uniref:phage holin n=1 Tax=Exiguobacterium sp. s22 TaxID=2751272 RepID=UPI001BE77E62|nr:phage holin [Exiguobacterium sp. s22]